MRSDTDLNGARPFDDNTFQAHLEQFIRPQRATCQYHAVVKVLRGAVKRQDDKFIHNCCFSNPPIDSPRPQGSSSTVRDTGVRSADVVESQSMRRSC